MWGAAALAVALVLAVALLFERFGRTVACFLPDDKSRGSAHPLAEKKAPSPVSEALRRQMARREAQQNRAVPVAQPVHSTFRSPVYYNDTREIRLRFPGVDIPARASPPSELAPIMIKIGGGDAVPRTRRSVSRSPAPIDSLFDFPAAPSPALPPLATLPAFAAVSVVPASPVKDAPWPSRTRRNKRPASPSDSDEGHHYDVAKRRRSIDELDADLIDGMDSGDCTPMECDEVPRRTRKRTERPDDAATGRTASDLKVRRTGSLDAHYSASARTAAVDERVAVQGPRLSPVQVSVLQPDAPSAIASPHTSARTVAAPSSTRSVKKVPPAPRGRAKLHSHPLSAASLLVRGRVAECAAMAWEDADADEHALVEEILRAAAAAASKSTKPKKVAVEPAVVSSRS